ncbi:hypothetical protein EVAR_429_1 [Eumeta japonica]|uniref:Uncharacterized protein n=1 Tax=Eumeta variegata TaxID=151549 RepID=A0A4C1SAD0_EUMVA|nr:hypothetical protein EVAR_429_1 [Eumeta japonica]
MGRTDRILQGRRQFGTVDVGCGLEARICTEVPHPRDIWCGTKKRVAEERKTNKAIVFTMNEQRCVFLELNRTSVAHRREFSKELLCARPSKGLCYIQTYTPTCYLFPKAIAWMVSVQRLIIKARSDQLSGHYKTNSDDDMLTGVLQFSPEADGY